MEKQIALIRIAGMVRKVGTVAETLDRMRMRKKYVCVILKETPEITGMIKRIKDMVAYGPISEEVLLKLIKERGRLMNKANARVENPEKIVKEFLAGKDLMDLGVKPYFRLHPPRGGIDSRLHFGRRKGVLGNNKEAINKLIERML